MRFDTFRHTFFWHILIRIDTIWHSPNTLCVLQFSLLFVTLGDTSTLLDLVRRFARLCKVPRTFPKLLECQRGPWGKCCQLLDPLPVMPWCEEVGPLQDDHWEDGSDPKHDGGAWIEHVVGWASPLPKVLPVFSDSNVTEPLHVYCRCAAYHIHVWIIWIWNTWIWYNFFVPKKLPSNIVQIVVTAPITF